MNTVKHTPTKWFLTMREMKEGDHHAEITLSKDSGFAEDSDEYMRVSGICSVSNAKKLAAAPVMLHALESIRGIEAWIPDKEMKTLFQKLVYSAISEATE